MVGGAWPLGEQCRNTPRGSLEVRPDFLSALKA